MASCDANKNCCFIGHRDVVLSPDSLRRLTKLIEGLIVDEGVNVFLFGSRSAFDDTCYGIVREFRIKYPEIILVAYTCRNECVYKFNDKKPSGLGKIKCYDEEIRSERFWGKAAYINRNKAMIDAADLCVFYYDENKNSRNNPNRKQVKTGTEIAFEYAKKKNAAIINVAVLG